MGYGLVVGSKRLFRAAGFLLEAIESGDPARRSVADYASEPLAEGPPPTRRFTRVELREAMGMLVRLGLTGFPAAPVMTAS